MQSIPPKPRLFARPAPPRRSGFTLIELLVVIAIIGLFAGAIGVALRGGDQSTAIGSAQRTVSSMITAARAQAAMNGTPARLIIYAETGAAGEFDKLLRYLQIVTWDGSKWVPQGAGTYLPKGAYIVPPDDSLSSVVSFSSVPAWPAPNRRRSDLNYQTGNPPTNQPKDAKTIEGGSSADFYFIEFNGRGSPVGGRQIVAVAPGRIQPGRLEFSQPEGVLATMALPTGAVVNLADPSSLDQP
jgi:prepilin-type N-terminal cleavage/methylation domain-containing protein